MFKKLLLLFFVFFLLFSCSKRKAEEIVSEPTEEEKGKLVYAEAVEALKEGDSFYANKNITTAGEGGAISTNNAKYSEKIRKLSLHGMSKDGWKRFAKGGKWVYDVSELGYKYNLTDVAAAFGLWQFGQVTDWSNKEK